MAKFDKFYNIQINIHIWAYLGMLCSSYADKKKYLALISNKKKLSGFDIIPKKIIWLSYDHNKII